ncbi:UDP-N-acetylglucosamine--N-acetylmuramyl-(pentapeptide) pyrophosphoryl-undecaprenol N-acetylglucosamine transferase, partial [Myxococcus fulvus]
AGAALMFQESELTGAKLAETLRTLKAHPERLKGMEKKAALLGRPEAAKELADVCVDLMVQTWGPSGRERATPEAKKAPRSES